MHHSTLLLCVVAGCSSPPSDLDRYRQFYQELSDISCRSQPQCPVAAAWVQKCMERHDRFPADAELALQAGRARFDAAAAQRCLDEYSRAPRCSAFEALRALERCPAVVLPLVPAGGACSGPGQCVTGTCEIPSGQCEGTCPSSCNPGVDCPPWPSPSPVPEGEPCEVPIGVFDNCADGLYCDGSDGYALFTGVCHPLQAAGAHGCNVNGSCQDGLRCIYTGDPTGTCVRQLTVGDACDPAFDACQPGARCDAVSARCVLSAFAVGDPCDDDHPCQADTLYCSSSSTTCQAKATTWQACEPHAASCLDGICDFHLSTCQPASKCTGST